MVLDNSTLTGIKNCFEFVIASHHKDEISTYENNNIIIFTLMKQ